MSTLGGPSNLDGISNRSEDQKKQALPSNSIFHGVGSPIVITSSSSSNSSSEDSSDCEDEEERSGYKPGGYHRVHIGDLFKGRQYKIVKKLGWGHFSTVWLSQDLVNEREVALKVVKSARNYTEAAMDEIKILKTISKNSAASRHYVIDLLDHFFHIGPNGTHVVMVFEVLGKSLLSAVREAHYRGLPPVVVQRLGHQMLVGLEFLQTKCGVVHTDLKPENVLLTPESNVKEHPDQVEVRVVDFGNACWVDKHFTDNIQTRQYRSIEALLGINYGPPCDIWSLACILFEISTGDFLFEPRDGDGFCKDDDHLAQMMETLGPIPKRIALAGKYSKKFFNVNGELKRIGNLQPWHLERVLYEKYRWKRREAAEFSALLLKMLTYNPLMRPSASELLRSKWFRRKFSSESTFEREGGDDDEAAAAAAAGAGAGAGAEGKEKKEKEHAPAVEKVDTKEKEVEKKEKEGVQQNPLCVMEKKY